MSCDAWTRWTNERIVCIELGRWLNSWQSNLQYGHVTMYAREWGSQITKDPWIIIKFPVKRFYGWHKTESRSRTEIVYRVSNWHFQIKRIDTHSTHTGFIFACRTHLSEHLSFSKIMSIHKIYINVLARLTRQPVSYYTISAEKTLIITTPFNGRRVRKKQLISI